MTTVSVTTARNDLYNLLEEVSLGKRVAITNKGETKAILISPEELASWEATIDVMSDPELVKSIKKGLDDIKHGRVIPWEKVKKELNIK